MDAGEASESTRLLWSVDAATTPKPTQPTHLDRTPRFEGSPAPPNARRTILVVATIQIILSIGSYVSFAAQLAILQDIVCKNHYHEPPPEGADNRCKADAVQSEVAFINGWKDVFEMLPGMPCLHPPTLQPNPPLSSSYRDLYLYSA